MRLNVAWVALALVVVLAGCGRREIDFGRQSGHEYSNRYLGLSLLLPEGWHVQPEEVNRQLMARGRQILAGEAEESAASTERAANLQTVPLFSVFKHPPGAVVEFNPNMIGLADRTDQMPGLANGRQYLQHARRMIEEGGVTQMRVLDDSRSELIGGVDFYIMDLEIDSGGITMRQEQYVTLRGEYALILVITYDNEADREVMLAAARSLRFED